MLTKNHYVAIRAAIMSKGGTIVTTANRTLDTGDSVTFSKTYKAAMLTQYSSSYGLFLGTGTTPATIDDYIPESPITSEITVTFPSAVTTSFVDGVEEWTVTLGVTASSAVTISEIGVVGQVTFSAASWNVLLDRTVLESPISLAAGESKQIVYTIRFNYAA